MPPFLLGERMKTTDEIHKIRDNYKELYNDTKTEWDIDQTFYDDTFPVPGVKTPHKIVRSGLGRRIIDSPAEQMVTSNPQAFFEMLKGAEDIGDRLGTESNDWFASLKRANPNPFKESLKNKLLLGVNYIRVAHNETWVTGKKEQIGIPVMFVLIDPRVVFASPEEDEEGIPRNVLIMYDRQPEEVLIRYPNWVRPVKDGKEPGKKTAWLEYWDADTYHCEADEVVVKHAQNIYGVTPFTRSYSGFGRRASDGNMSSLIVGDLRFVRTLIQEETAIRSDISSVMHLFAHKPKTIVVPQGTIIDKRKLSQELSFGAYDLNVIGLPDGSRFTDEQIDQPSQEAFAYLGEITARIERYSPMIMAGFPFGTSGRQQDITATAAMRRYDTVMENTETEWAKAIELAYRVIDKVPTLSAPKLRKGDIKSKFRCEVKLRAKDPVEEDRKATLGSRLLQNNEIDPETNLIEFKGYTKERARQILVDTLKWKVLLGSPDIAELIGYRAAEKSGMAEDLEILKQRRMQMEGQLGKTPTPSERVRTQGEVKTPLGDEEASRRGARTPPVRY